MNLKFTATPRQWDALESLAYWIAESAYTKERYSADDPDLDRIRQTIAETCFPECDRLAIPYWVQNTVTAYADDWRRYESTYTAVELSRQGITREEIAA